MSDREALMRFEYMGVTVLNRSIRETMSMTIGEICDQMTIHREIRGIKKDSGIANIDDVL